MVHGSRVATGAESWLRRRPRAAAKKLLPLPVGSVAGRGRQWASGYQSASGRSRKAPLGEPGSVVVVVTGGALVLVTPGAVVVAVGNVVVEGKGDVVVVAPGAVVVVAPGAVVVVGPMVAVVLVTVRTVVVVVRAGAPHASQQLGADPMNAVPPLGGLQAPALRLIVQVVLPATSVRQQVTAPGMPQVDCDAQDTTVSSHSSRSSPSATASRATLATQCRYLP